MEVSASGDEKKSGMVVVWMMRGFSRAVRATERTC